MDLSRRCGGQDPTLTGYVRQIHVELIAVLVIICSVLALYGWTLRPQSGGFPAVPENLSITVTDSGVKHVSEMLNRTPGNGARLVLTQTIVQNSVQPTARWTVEVDNIGNGHVCTPSSYVYNGSASFVYKLSPERVTHPRVQASVTPGPLPKLTDIAGSGFLYVWLCWDSGAPVSLNGSYLSAQFPAIQAPYPKVLAVTRELTPGAGETADYAIQSHEADRDDVAGLGLVQRAGLG